MSYKLLKIKSVLFLAFTLLTSFTCFAQYTGGRGDGFAMVETAPLAQGIKKVSYENGIHLSPNPVCTGQNARLQFEKQLNSNTTLIIMDLTGRVFRSESITAGTQQYLINTSGMLSGIYIVKIVSAEYQIEKKLTIL